MVVRSGILLLGAVVRHGRRLALWEEGVMRMSTAETIALMALIVNVVIVTYTLAKKK